MKTNMREKSKLQNVFQKGLYYQRLKTHLQRRTLIYQPLNSDEQWKAHIIHEMIKVAAEDCTIS